MRRTNKRILFGVLFSILFSVAFSGVWISVSKHLVVLLRLKYRPEAHICAQTQEVRADSLLTLQESLICRVTVFQRATPC